jgi:hypothetical protein
VDASIEVEAEFTIISSTLDHLDLMELNRLNEIALVDDEETQTEPTIREEIHGLSNEEKSSKPMESDVRESDDSSNKGGGHSPHIHEHEVMEEKQRTAMETVEKMLKTETKYPMSEEDANWIERAKVMMRQDEERWITNKFNLVKQPLMQNAIIKTHDSSHNAKHSEKSMQEFAIEIKWFLIPSLYLGYFSGLTSPSRQRKFILTCY